MSGILLNARRTPPERKERRPCVVECDNSRAAVLRLSLRLAFDVLRVLCAGIRDSLRIRPFLRLTVYSPAFRRRLMRCAILNGVILLWFVLGCVWLLCRRIVPISLGLFFPEETVGHADTDFWPDVCMTLSRALLVSPLYVFALPFNTLWFRDMARIAYDASVLSHERSGFLHSPPLPGLRFREPWQVLEAFTLPLSQLVHRFLLTLLFTAFVALTSTVGGSWLSILQLALLTSYYACEYRWDLLHRSTDARFFEFETAWIYHVGFGLPATVIVTLFDLQASIWGNVCICLVFPWLVTNALHFPPQSLMSVSPALLPLREIAHKELRRRSGRLFWASARHGLRHSRRARRFWVPSHVGTGVHPGGHSGALQFTFAILKFLALVVLYQGLSVLIQMPVLSLLSSLLDAAALKWRIVSAFPVGVCPDSVLRTPTATPVEDTFQIIDAAADKTPPASRLHRRSRSRTLPQNKPPDKTDRELCDLVLEQRSELIHRFLR
eukprot:Gregarina_sp_Poly_1__6478@NODE_346_length_9378_cov_211_258941_g289_i0_p2_GENE_NODE_346_length_9378_cov_211_258941_g289_i0NODE_346_length_9378_cov_211_258941_g289_i0_p2_ORF_typecomplete_len495_score43_09EI24/PF07264_11/2_2e11EI24/PF07264_11/3_3e02DUF2390/PF09523_10/0_034DUF2390/PF09523_10/5_5e03_NODE_346_length_9378_cov_211_258941_g289_i05232007